MDYIIVPIALLFGFSLKSLFKKFNAKDHILLDQLFFYHMIMSFVFYIYIRTIGGDAWGYWRLAGLSNFEDLWSLIIMGKANANHYMFLINYVPANLLNLDFFSGCMLYGTLGYSGLVFLLASLKELFPLLHDLKKIKILNFSIFPTLLFLPNFHFWSAGVGKDTLLFFCVCAFFYALLNLRKRWFIMLIVILLSYPLRPHILLFLLTGFGVAYILRSKLFLFQKILIMGGALIVFMPLLSNVLEFAKIDELSVEAFTEFGESKAGVLSRSAGSSIDISALPYPLQVLTFLYRPLFFDAHNVLSLLASVENVIWLVLSWNFFTNQPLKLFKSSHILIMAAFLFWIIGALAFAPVLGNLGIIIRERNMFLPGFIIFAVAGLYNTPKFRKYEWWLKQQKLGWEKPVNKSEK